MNEFVCSKCASGERLMRLSLVLSGVAIIAGCGLLVAPKDAADIATYNNQVFQIVMSVLTSAATVLGFIGLWIKANWDKRELERKTETAADDLAKKTERTAEDLVQKTESVAREVIEQANERTQKVLTEVKEGLAVNVKAIEAANNTNEKIMALQGEIVEQTKRAPSRSTDVTR